MLPQRLVELGGNPVSDSSATELLETLDVCGSAALGIEAVICERRSEEFRPARARPFPDDPDARGPVLISIVVSR